MICETVGYSIPNQYSNLVPHSITESKHYPDCDHLMHMKTYCIEIRTDPSEETI